MHFPLSNIDRTLIFGIFYTGFRVCFGHPVGHETQVQYMYCIIFYCIIFKETTHFKRSIFHKIKSSQVKLANHLSNPSTCFSSIIGMRRKARPRDLPRLSTDRDSWTRSCWSKPNVCSPRPLYSWPTVICFPSSAIETWLWRHQLFLSYNMSTNIQIHAYFPKTQGFSTNKVFNIPL